MINPCAAGDFFHLKGPDGQTETLLVDNSDHQRNVVRGRLLDGDTEVVLDLNRSDNVIPRTIGPMAFSGFDGPLSPETVRRERERLSRTRH